MGVLVPIYRRQIDAAHRHANGAAAAYAEIPDRSGQIRAQLLLARIMRAKSWHLDEVDVPLATAEYLAEEHNLSRLAGEAKRLRVALTEGDEYATVAEYWPIN